MAFESLIGNLTSTLKNHAEIQLEEAQRHLELERVEEQDIERLEKERYQQYAFE